VMLKKASIIGITYAMRFGFEVSAPCRTNLCNFSHLAPNLPLRMFGQGTLKNLLRRVKNGFEPRHLAILASVHQELHVPANLPDLFRHIRTGNNVCSTDDH